MLKTYRVLTLYLVKDMESFIRENYISIINQRTESLCSICKTHRCKEKYSCSSLSELSFTYQGKFIC